MIAFIPAILISLILCIYAKKDIKDRIIPYKWWIAGIIPAVLGLVTSYFTLSLEYWMLQLVITLLVCTALFVLGITQTLNGADAIFMIFLMFSFMPLAIGGISFGIISIILAMWSGLIICVISLKVNHTTKIAFLLPLAVGSVCMTLVLLARDILTNFPILT